MRCSKSFVLCVAGGMMLAGMSISPMTVANDKTPAPTPTPKPDPTPTQPPADDPVEITGSYNRRPIRRASRSIDASPLPAGFEDAAFEHFVDISLVGPALNSRDAEQLTDIALQLGEGERVLLRSHKSGLTAKGVLKRAMAVAVEQADTSALQRLERVATQTKNQELVAELASLKKIGGPSRAVDPALTVSLEHADIDTIIEIKECLDSLKEASLVGDPALIDEIESQVIAIDGASDAQRAALKQRTQKVRSEIVGRDSAEDRVLATLASVSRACNTPDCDYSSDEQYSPAGDPGLSKLNSASRGLPFAGSLALPHSAPKSSSKKKGHVAKPKPSSISPSAPGSLNLPGIR